MDKKSFIVGVKASIAEILERSTNKWVSVLEPGASFSAILAKNGLSPQNHTAAFRGTDRQRADRTFGR